MFASEHARPLTPHHHSLCIDGSLVYRMEPERVGKLQRTPPANESAESAAARELKMQLDKFKGETVPCTSGLLIRHVNAPSDITDALQ